MYAQLGNIQFDGLFGPDSFRGRKAQALARHERIDGKPRLQKTGDELDEVQMDITLHSKFCDPEAEINRLHASCANGEILPLITGAGEFVGDFTIAEVGRTFNHLDPQGRIIWARVQVNLLEAFQEGSAAANAAINAAFARAKNEPPLVPFTTTIQGKGISAMSSLVDAGSYAATAEVDLATASARPSEQLTHMNRAQKNLEKAQTALATYEAKLQEVKDTINNFPQIKSNIASAATQSGAAITAIQSGDLTGAIGSVQSLQLGLFNVRGASASVLTLTAIRRI